MSLKPDYQLRAGIYGLRLSLALLLFASPALRAQQAGPVASSTNSAWQQPDWLQPAGQQAATGTTVTATAGQDIKDPASVLASGSLWQEKYGLNCTQKVADSLSLTYGTSAVTLTDGLASSPSVAGSPTVGTPVASGTGSDLYQNQSAGLQFQPLDAVKVSGDVHASSSDFTNPDMTAGTGLSAEGKLPLNSVLMLNMKSNRTGTDLISNATTYDNAYEAQVQQPLGKLPLTATLKGHYEEITMAGAPTERLPSLEQTLVWKPVQDATLQMGLRQQQYQELPGVSDQFNEALFADWSQNLMPTITWHSYAEMMNSKELESITPSSTPQASAPGSNPSLNSAVPVSLVNETMTFTTGPAFKLQDDLSASLEYSSRWDKAPQPGSAGEEQRLSISLKGSF